MNPSPSVSASFRDGNFDLVIAAGPNLPVWPSHGAKVLSATCAQMGLSVGVFGGESLTVRGLLPLPGTGGVVMVQDAQNRLHRLNARSVVRISSGVSFPDPFPGWRSPGLIPLATALRLKKESQVRWEPATVVLGTGNPALRFASSLLESGAARVYCVESWAQWGAKRFAGWEVERRRFEMNGGRLIEANPISLAQTGPLKWELRLRDPQGVRLLEVARVVSAGPYRDLPEVREHPPGSLLFEIEQSAGATQGEDVEGWVLEEERARWLAGRIVRALVNDLGEHRERLDRMLQRAKGRVRRYLRHREDPYTPAYQGKWLSSASTRELRSFSGTPAQEHMNRAVASVECFEQIPCNLCQKACPEQAIELGPVPRKPGVPILTESRCTGCGLCVQACPSSAVSMVLEADGNSRSEVTLPWRGSRVWAVGEFATILNRRGESLGTGRVLEFHAGHPGQVRLEVPSHLVWEARALRPPRLAASEDPNFLAAEASSSQSAGKSEVQLNGDRRILRGGVPASLSFFELGAGRSEDVLLCSDGSCGLCHVLVDGVKKAACQVRIHQGMNLRVPAITAGPSPAPAGNLLCPCLGITMEEVIEKLRQGDLRSPEAVLSVLHLGEGKCHGQLCMDAFRRILLEQGLDVAQWIDWRFPWSDWVLAHNSAPPGSARS